MGSFPSHEQALIRPMPPQHIQSSVSSGQTDGRGGGGAAFSGRGELSTAPSFRNATNALARRMSRQIIAKKLVKGRVLFLGLDGAGKTTLVQQLSHHSGLEFDNDNFSDSSSPFGGHGASPASLALSPAPFSVLQPASSYGDLMAPDGTRMPRVFPESTKATSNVLYRVDDDKYVQFVDVPGRRAYRPTHWRAALAGDPPMAFSSNATATPSSNIPIVGVVFVVDATDRTRFPLVARELVAFQRLRDQPRSSVSSSSSSSSSASLATWLQRAPFFLILNKVDAAASGSRVDANNSERRRASRAMRQELKRAFDHQLRMDQKRNPRDYAHTMAASVAVGESPISNGGGLANPPPTPLSSSLASSSVVSKKRAALAEANSNRKTLLMTSLVECCAFDRECVHALHVWIRDEIRRLWGGP